MFCANKITEIFCKVDDFCKEFIPVWEKSMLAAKKRNRKFTMSVSEVMTIQILFHLSGYKEFKSFYLGYVQKFMKEYFPKTVSYNRMVELKKQSFMPMSIFLKSGNLSNCTGIGFDR